MADFLGGIPPALLDGVGVVGLAVLFIVALARGWLVTGTSHEQAMKDLREARDAALADLRAQRDDWREAYRTSDARGDVNSQQMGQVLEYVRTSTHVIQALGHATGAAQVGGDSGAE